MIFTTISAIVIIALVPAHVFKSVPHFIYWNFKTFHWSQLFFSKRSKYSFIFISVESNWSSFLKSFFFLNRCIFIHAQTFIWMNFLMNKFFSIHDHFYYQTKNVSTNHLILKLRLVSQIQFNLMLNLSQKNSNQNMRICKNIRFNWIHIHKIHPFSCFFFLSERLIPSLRLLLHS